MRRKNPAVARESNKIDLCQVRAICLATSQREEQGASVEAVLPVIFNYILRLLHMGCQWKELPISKDKEGNPENHYTRIYRAFRRWQANGCFDAFFAQSVVHFHESNLLDTSIIHGDGTTTAAKKRGGNIGRNEHKEIEGDQVVAFCDQNCNIIAPFISAPGNQNESPLLREALHQVMHMATKTGIDLKGAISTFVHDGIGVTHLN